MFRLILTSAVIALGAGCSCGGPKAGDPCNQVACADSTTMLVCTTGTYQALHCPGPGGCTENNTGTEYQVICYLDGTQPGDPCPDGVAGFVYCTASNAALICDSTKWVAWTCTQPCVDSNFDGTGGACQ